MSVMNASLWRRGVLTLIVGAALALPMGAKADWTKGLSVRVGAFLPQKATTRSVTDFAVWGGGIDYQLPWFPHLLSGNWTTSVSLDFHYSERNAGIVRYFPISLNWLYSFEEQNGNTPYAGFCATAATYGTTGLGANNQPTVTRFGGGIIVGLNFAHRLYVEGRYEWIDSHNTTGSPEGFRGYVGYRF